jgi:hypothetical protein
MSPHSSYSSLRCEARAYVLPAITIAETNNESWADCWRGLWADSFANRVLQVSRSRASFFT